MNLSELSAELKRRIDAKSASEVDEPRWHLGASEIGDECLRRVWYKYRWIKKENFGGRMRRLFKRGHQEEPRIVELLRSVGLSVITHDPNTGNQFLTSALHGHYGGSSDGKVAGSVGECHLPTVQLECKTHNAKSFADLVKHGLKKSKPKHYVQMCVYGKFNNLAIGLYFAVCKDNDDIYTEFVELDMDVADNAERKAEALVFARTPPIKLSNKATFYVCKMCHLSEICHGAEKAEKNCRSCVFAMPTVDGEASWHCSQWNIAIPREHAPKGCDGWRSILDG